MTNRNATNANFYLGGDLTVNRWFWAMRVTGEGIGVGHLTARSAQSPRRAVELGVIWSTKKPLTHYGADHKPTCSSQKRLPVDQKNSVRDQRRSNPPDPVIGATGDLKSQTSCRRSLKRLPWSEIDLYQLHTVDSKVHRESLGALKTKCRTPERFDTSIIQRRAERIARARKNVPLERSTGTILRIAHQKRFDLCEKEPWLSGVFPSVANRG